MKNLYLILTLGLFLACAPKPQDVNEGQGRRSVSVHADIKPFFDKFENDTHKSASGVSAEIVNLDKPKAGLCTRYSNGDLVVSVDAEFWSKASFNSREQLVYHELGHCILGRSHDDAVKAVGCFKSVMNSKTFGVTDCYANNRQYYYTELTN